VTPSSSGSTGFATDSTLEGAGFEPSVPLEVLTVGIVPCRLRGPFHASLPKTKFAADSSMEGAVTSELVSAQFPVIQGKYRTFPYYVASATTENLGCGRVTEIAA
jgi:hypothetical protein